MPIRVGESQWTGGIGRGSGQVRLGSGAFEGNLSLQSRINDTGETNPEELVGAALATCFNMALADLLEGHGHAPRQLATTATVHQGPTPDGYRILTIALRSVGEVPGLDEATFQALATEAEHNCPVSRALTGTEITLEAQLRAPA